MSSPERIYRGSVRALSLVFIVLGLALLASTLAQGGGPLAIGTLLGVIFIAVGVGRLWLTGIFRGWRGGRGAENGGPAPARRPPSPRDRTRGRDLP
jgi:hypothetical protein